MRGSKIISGVACCGCALGLAVYGCASKFVVDAADGGSSAFPLPDATTTTTSPPPTDGALPPSDGGADGPVAPTTRCTPGAAFGPPELVAEISTTSGEPAAALTEDELTIYFSRNGTLMIATRATRSAPFGNVRSAGLPNGGADDNPALTFDGRQLFFSTTERGDSGAAEVYVAQVVDGGLASPSPVRGVPPETTDPFPNGDAGALYYSAGRDGGTSDIFFATGLGSPAVNEQRLAISDAESDGQPVLSRDELSLYIGSRRAGTVGLSDIFVATRARVGDPFANAVSLGPAVNSAGNDLPVWISTDACVLYFTSDRPGGAGGRDIYRTTRGR